ASLCWQPPPALSTFSTPDPMRALLGLALASLAAAGALTAVAACGGKPARARGRGLTYYESYDPRSLDPALSTDVPTGEMVTLTEPLAIFPKFLAMPVASVVPVPPPSDLAERPVGTGAWRFVAWQHDDYLVFARNPSYWGGAPASDTLLVRVIPEPLTRAAEFEAGRLSVIEVPFGETARWRGERPDQLVEKPALRVVYVALNNRRGPLRDPRVRQAINHAVNVPEILATVYGGRGVLARG